MTDIGNPGISTIIETRFFYCWIQLPAVVVWLVFWLALSPSEDHCVSVKCEQSWSLLSKPLHRVPREAASNSELYPLCCLHSSTLGKIPPTLATFLFPAHAPPEYSFSLLIRFERASWMTSSRTIACWSRWASDLPFGWHLPLNFSRRQRSDSNFKKAVCS